MGDTLGELEVAAHDGQPTIGPDPPVHAGAGGTPLCEGLLHRGPPTADRPHRGGGVGEPGKRAGSGVRPPVEVVAQQLPPRRQGRGPPWRCRHRRRIGGEIEERGEGGHAGDAVGDGMVQLHEQPNPPVGQTRQEPQLPQRAGPVQRPPAQPLAGREQLRVVGVSAEGHDVHVLGQVERLRVDPQRPAQPAARQVQPLAESGQRRCLGGGVVRPTKPESVAGWPLGPQPVPLRPGSQPVPLRPGELAGSSAWDVVTSLPP
jgi:hypothetical protein